MGTVKLRNFNLKIFQYGSNSYLPMINWDYSICCSIFLPVKAVSEDHSFHLLPLLMITPLTPWSFFVVSFFPHCTYFGI